MSIGDIIEKIKPFSAEKESGRKGDQYRDTRSTIKLGIWIIFIGFGGFLLWASFAPLDEGVPCQGVVSIATKRKVVENLRGGRVEKVNVREGQMVQQGEVLITLDSQTARARYDEVHQHYLGMRATADRLQAEMSGAASISFHKDLLADADGTLARQNPILDQVGGEPVVLLLGDDGQSVRGFRPQLDGEFIELFLKPGSKPFRLVDAKSGSEWDFQGVAVSGPLQGRRLERLVIQKDYWFDWKTYHPETQLYKLGR